MKKLLTMIMTLTFMLLPLNVNAAYDFVRASDYGASDFVHRMVQGNIYKQMVANGAVIAFVEPNYRPNAEDQQYFPGYSVYASVFGIKDAPNPDGEVLFYTDSKGYVFAVRAVGMGNVNVTGPVMLMVMEALGLNDQEAAVLLHTQSVNAEVWCSATNRRIVRIISDNTGNNVLFCASPY